MKAFQINTPGPQGKLTLVDLPKPELLPSQVLVRVSAFGINRADLLQVLGKYPAPADVPADIPGMEFSGVVEALGSGYAGTLRAGAMVAGIVGGGAYAEYVALDPACLLQLPAGFSMPLAAAIPEVYVTADDALSQLQLKSGESLLVHAVGSGLGVAALQLARAMGCSVIGSSRSAQKLEALREQGLAHGIDTSAGFDDLARRVRAAGPQFEHGVCAVFDLLGASAFEQNLQALRQGGRMICLATLGGHAANFELSLLMKKRLSIIGTVLRSRSVQEKALAVEHFRNGHWALLAQGELQPILDRVLPSSELEAALDRLRRNENLGKVVVCW